jgi:hypothetical protein
MTDDTMHLLELVQKTDDGDFLKLIAEAALQRIMDCDVENVIGAARHQLVVSDAHHGLKAAIRQVLGATWQRCRVHTMRNLLARVPRAQQSRVITT